MSFKRVILLICFISISSCSLSGGPIPADHYYRLPEASAEKLNSFKFDSLLLHPVNVEGLYHERSILYVETSTPLEVKRYHYHYWVETPAKLVSKYVQEYLSQTGIIRNMSFNVASQAADVETDITIINFERIVDQGSVQILINIRISVAYNNDSKQNFTKPYAVKVDADSNSMHATAEAFGEALNQIMNVFVSDLSKNM